MDKCTDQEAVYLSGELKKQLEKDLGFSEKDVVDYGLGYVEFQDEVKNHGHTEIPNVVARYPKISPTARCLYAIIVSYAWKVERLRKNYVFPTVNTLGKLLGRSAAQVHFYKRELEKARLIKVIHRRRIPGSCRQACNVYRILNVPEEIIEWYRENISKG